VTGSVVVESIFLVPGLGRFFMYEEQVIDHQNLPPSLRPAWSCSMNLS
jgi:ABC-type dipeptide/oligopeptide/nickel transport system permease component